MENGVTLVIKKLTTMCTIPPWMLKIANSSNSPKAKTLPLTCRKTIKNQVSLEQLMLRGQSDCLRRSNEMRRNEKKIRFIVSFLGPVVKCVREMEMVGKVRL